MVPHGGLKMGDLNARQKTAAMDLLAATLSRSGYEKVQQIMEGDELLKPTGRGNTPMFGKDLVLYFLPRHAFGKGPLDAAIRRASSGAEHYG